MQIIEGKFYKTRDGRKVGPFSFPNGLHDGHCAEAPQGAWTMDGRFNKYYPDNVKIGLNDLIEEWVEPTATPTPAGPVRMVRQIVPGVYGRVEVSTVNDLGLGVGLTDSAGVARFGIRMKADELRSAAMVFSQLAEALDDQP